MSIKKAAYCCMGFVSFYLFFVINFYIEHDYSFYDRGSPHHFDFEVNRSLSILYSSCRFYWMDAGPTSACESDNLSPTTYGYIPSKDVVVSMERGTKADFSALGKHRDSETLYKIGPDGEIRILQGYESEAARKKLYKSVTQDTR